MSNCAPFRENHSQRTSGTGDFVSFREHGGSGHPPIVGYDQVGQQEFGIFEQEPESHASVELTESLVVSVTVLWGNDVLCATYVPQGGSFTVGEGDENGKRCDFFLPKEVLGTNQLTILQMHGPCATLTVPGQAEGYLRSPSGIRTTFAGVDSGAPGNSGMPRAIELPMSEGSRGCLCVRAFTICFAAVRAPKPLARSSFAFTDRETITFFGMSLGAIASFMLSMAYFVPEQSDLLDSSFNEDQVYAMTRFLRASAEREREARDLPQSSNETTRDTEGGTGTRAKHDEGAMGNPTSRATNRRWAVQGPRDNPDPHIARTRLLWEAQHGGIIGLLNSGMAGDPRAPTAPWGRDEALGRDAISANGNMWGDDLGESYGLNGLGISGIGEGGGGRGEGIGLGDFDFGHGRGKGPGQGFGLDTGGLGHGTHHARSPRMRPGATVVSGRLPPEVIQRIVRQNYGRFRSCYELGLSRNPNLEGRVQVRFVIGRDGTVSNVQNGGSDLPDAGVVGCVVGAYYGLSFPQPEGGIVSVVYPIMFQPG
jgi:hypothetical protein